MDLLPLKHNLIINSLIWPAPFSSCPFWETHYGDESGLYDQLLNISLCCFGNVSSVSQNHLGLRSDHMRLLVILAAIYIRHLFSRFSFTSPLSINLKQFKNCLQIDILIAIETSNSLRRRFRWKTFGGTWRLLPHDIRNLMEQIKLSLLI